MNQQQKICEWKVKRLAENKKEPYCSKCLRLESLDVSQGEPKLCSNCVGHYHRDIKRGVI